MRNSCNEFTYTLDLVPSSGVFIYTGCLENGGLTLRCALNNQLVSLGKIVKTFLVTFWWSYNDLKIGSLATFNN